MSETITPVRWAGTNAFDVNVFTANEAKGFWENGLNEEGTINHANFQEKQVLIMSEMYEALEALRKPHLILKNNSAYESIIARAERLADPNHSIINDTFDNYFKGHIKDTFEDELADALIRLTDLRGFLLRNLGESFNKDTAIMRASNEGTSDTLPRMLEEVPSLNYPQLIMRVSYLVLIDIFKKPFCNSDYYSMIWKELFCAEILIREYTTELNIPIDKHVALKLAYNATRPIKHGKSF